MDNLLTTREVQELLKLDRTTVYRMLKDGRLSGLRVGQQWRFRRQEVAALLLGSRSLAPTSETALNARNSAADSVDALPLHCIQAIQDVFAQLAHISAVTTRLDGQPLTSVSNPCRLYSLIQSSAAGRQQCIASWRALARHSGRHPQVAACHAGLGSMHIRIDIDGQPAALLVAEQFRLDEWNVDTGYLAHAYDLDPEEVAMAVAEVPLFNEHAREELARCLQKVAATFEEIGRERARMLDRLQRIAALTAVDDAAVDDR